MLFRRGSNGGITNLAESKSERENDERSLLAGLMIRGAQEGSRVARSGRLIKTYKTIELIGFWKD